MVYDNFITFYQQVPTDMFQVLSLAWARPQELTRLLGRVVISQGDRQPSRKAQGWIHLQVEIANQKICI